MASAAMQLPVVKEGILIKEGLMARTWKKRYFILRGTVLFYYKEKGDTKPQGNILLENSSTVIATEKEKDRQFCFRVDTPGRKLYLSAISKQEMKEWMFTLNAVSQKPGPSSPSSSSVSSPSSAGDSMPSAVVMVADASALASQQAASAASSVAIVPDVFAQGIKYLRQGKTEKAILRFQACVNLGVISNALNLTLADALYTASRFDEALMQYDAVHKALNRIWPSSPSIDINNDSPVQYTSSSSSSSSVSAPAASFFIDEPYIRQRQCKCSFQRANELFVRSRFRDALKFYEICLSHLSALSSLSASSSSSSSFFSAPSSPAQLSRASFSSPALPASLLNHQAPAAMSSSPKVTAMLDKLRQRESESAKLVQDSMQDLQITPSSPSLSSSSPAVSSASSSASVSPPMSSVSLVDTSNVIYLVHYNMGHAHIHMNQLEKARDSFKSCIAHKKSYVPAYVQLALVQHRLGETWMSKTLMEEALKLEPRNKTLLNNTGFFFQYGKPWNDMPMELGDMMSSSASAANRRQSQSQNSDKGMAAALAAAASRPAPALLSRTEDLAKNDLPMAEAGEVADLQTALGYYERAVAEDPTYGDALFNLAVVLARLGKYPKAVELLKQLERLEPDNALIHCHIGKYLHILGTSDAEAEDALRKSLRLDATRARTWYYLAKHLYWKMWAASGEQVSSAISSSKTAGPESMPVPATYTRTNPQCVKEIVNCLTMSLKYDNDTVFISHDMDEMRRLEDFMTAFAESKPA